MSRFCITDFLWLFLHCPCFSKSPSSLNNKVSLHCLSQYTLLHGCLPSATDASKDEPLGVRAPGSGLSSLRATARACGHHSVFELILGFGQLWAEISSQNQMESSLPKGCMNLAHGTRCSNHATFSSDDTTRSQHIISLQTFDNMRVLASLWQFRHKPNQSSSTPWIT